MKVLFYQTSRGRMPVEEELDSLPKEAAAHAYQLLEEIEVSGFDASRVIFRNIEGKLWEIKMNLPGTSAYRIFLFYGSGRYDSFTSRVCKEIAEGAEAPY